MNRFFPANSLPLRIAYKILCQLNPNLIYTFKIGSDLKFRYPLKTSIGYGLFVAGFELDELNFVYNYLEEGDTFVDIGANGGIFTLYAAQKVGNSGQVFAFEPDDRMLSLLHDNIKLNNFSNVTTEKVAVGNENGSVRFAMAKDAALNSLKENDHPLQEVMKWDEVEMTTLDTLNQKHKMTPVKMVKIDVEGAEKMVFEGAERLFAPEEGNKIAILFECADRTASQFNYTTHGWLNELIDAGHHLYYFNSEGNTEKISMMKESFGQKIYSFLRLPN